MSQSNVIDCAGEVVAWSIRGVRVPVSSVVRALEAAGLETDVATTFKPRNAFARACHSLEVDADEDNVGRIIRRVVENDTAIVFQFTAEHLEEIGINQSAFDYEREGLVTLNKVTGDVTCQNQEIQLAARQALLVAMDIRTSYDITMIVQRLFKRHGDIIPVRPHTGGAYFVLKQYRPFLHQVGVFLGHLGNSLSRFPIVAGDPEGNRSIREAVTHVIDKALTEYESSLREFGPDTSTRTIGAVARKVQEARFRIDAYQEFLDEVAVKLRERAEYLGNALSSRIKMITSTDKDGGENEVTDAA